MLIAIENIFLPKMCSNQGCLELNIELIMWVLGGRPIRFPDTKEKACEEHAEVKETF